MADKVTVFLHDGIIEGVFSSSQEMQVCIIDFDRDTGDQDSENARWDACKAAGMILITRRLTTANRRIRYKYIV